MERALFDKTLFARSAKRSCLEEKDLLRYFFVRLAKIGFFFLETKIFGGEKALFDRTLFVRSPKRCCLEEKDFLRSRCSRSGFFK